MKIRMGNNIHGEITILNTYAPRMCYNKGEIEEYWANVGATVKKINTKGCLIWGTGNNGQISQRNKGKQATIKSAGQWTLSTKKPNRGMG